MGGSQDPQAPPRREALPGGRGEDGWARQVLVKSGAAGRKCFWLSPARSIALPRAPRRGRRAPDPRLPQGTARVGLERNPAACVTADSGGLWSHRDATAAMGGGDSAAHPAAPCSPPNPLHERSLVPLQRLVMAASPHQARRRAPTPPATAAASASPRRSRRLRCCSS